MSLFLEKINLHWADHATKTEAVLKELEGTFSLISNSQELDQFLSLILHIYTEHKLDYLGAEHWLRYIVKNNKVEVSALASSQIKVAQLIFQDKSILKLEKIDSSMDYIFTCAFLINLYQLENKCDEALTLLKKLDERVMQEIDNLWAHKRIAILANNVACRIEEVNQRSLVQTELMITAAHASRKYWEKAGTWVEVERAEYRLSRSYQKAKDYINSIKHANLCLTICEINSAPHLELFFAYEAIAHVEKSIAQPLRSLEKMKNIYNLMNESDKQMCRESLEYFIAN